MKPIINLTNDQINSSQIMRLIRLIMHNSSFIIIASFTMLSCIKPESMGEYIKLTSEQRIQQLQVELDSLESLSGAENIDIESINSNRHLVRSAGLFRDAEYQGIDITVVLKNKASIATLKDVRYRLEFISKTQSVIQTEEFTVFEFFGPQQTIYDERTIMNVPGDYEKIRVMVASVKKPQLN